MNFNYKRIDREHYLLSENLDKNNSSFIYGQVNSYNIISILKSILNGNLNDNLNGNLNDNLNGNYQYFLDIGSGCGKLCIHIATIFNNLFVSGVEIDYNRFSYSSQLLDNLSIYNVDFIHNDFNNIFFGNFDIIYCCNIIFSKEDNRNLYKKILNEFQGLLFLYDFDHTIKPFLINTYNVSTSWNNNVNLYLFHI